MNHNVAKKEKLTYYERTLNLTKVDLAEAALEDGIPMLKITFETDKTMAFTDKDGNIVSGEGTPQVKLNFYKVRIFVMCLKLKLAFTQKIVFVLSVLHNYY